MRRVGTMKAALVAVKSVSFALPGWAGSPNSKATTEITTGNASPKKIDTLLAAGKTRFTGHIPKLTVEVR